MYLTRQECSWPDFCITLCLMVEAFCLPYKVLQATL